jgi:hypothetical protein
MYIGRSVSCHSVRIVGHPELGPQFLGIASEGLRNVPAMAVDSFHSQFRLAARPL